uniref:Uncharacterized protein n=1 Tax=Lotharella vacuolata TaxID=74820 RepID=A0A0H5BHR4_9EUKA|nr:hypothetical protein [Lotharella vacuolata]
MNCWRFLKRIECLYSENGKYTQKNIISNLLIVNAKNIKNLKFLIKIFERIFNIKKIFKKKGLPFLKILNKKIFKKYKKVIFIISSDCNKCKILFLSFSHLLGYFYFIKYDKSLIENFNNLTSNFELIIKNFRNSYERILLNYLKKFFTKQSFIYKKKILLLLITYRYLYLMFVIYICSFFSYQFIRYLISYDYGYYNKKILNINLSKKKYNLIMILIKIIIL